MKTRIHRGTREIGGTCVEIEAEGRRVVLDVGVPLDVEPEDVPLHPVQGFDAADESLLGAGLVCQHGRASLGLCGAPTAMA